MAITVAEKLLSRACQRARRYCAPSAARCLRPGGIQPAVPGSRCGGRFGRRARSGGHFPVMVML
jgi:hypothetical protein